MGKKIFLIVLVLYVLIFLGFYFFQEAIIFRPKKLKHDYNFSFELKFEEVNLQTSDNATLNALHFKVENPKGVILYFHGNKDNLERWGDIASKFTDYEYDVFVIDYRGFGKSTGTRTELLMYSDAQLCYDFLKNQYNENSIIVYGRSLGGAFATFVSAQNNPKQLILEATFNSLQDAVFNKLPILPYLEIFKFKFNSEEFIGDVNCPITILHGTKDRLIPIKNAEKLLVHSDSSKTEFIKIENGTHHNLSEFVEYRQSMDLLLVKD